jgi:hypothetical protein
MGVVFDEVVTQVEAPPQQPQTQQEQGGEQTAPDAKLRCWQQQQALFWRRQQRLEAD